MSNNINTVEDNKKNWKNKELIGVVICIVTAQAAFNTFIEKSYAGRDYHSEVRTCFRQKKNERETGLEPATSTLARWRSTTELFPLYLQFRISNIIT
jgi:hypothetical protein